MFTGALFLCLKIDDVWHVKNCTGKQDIKRVSIQIFKLVIVVINCIFAL